MKESLSFLLVCPACGAKLALREDLRIREEIEEGELSCPEHGSVGIRAGIPRFAGDGYTGNFGFQWQKFSKTQMDCFNGTTISRERFFLETRWDPEWMKGKRILDAGCGCGRFTQIALDSGAEVFACDLSGAIDACRKNFHDTPGLHLVQADLVRLPFPPQFFDAIFCLGVIQHTPSPKETFAKLSTHLKPGAPMAVDAYPRKWHSFLQPKYLLRPLLGRRTPEELFKLCGRFAPPLFKLSDRIASISFVGKTLKKFIPMANYRGLFPLSDEQLEEWALLEAIDALGAFYDHPQTCAEVRRWFEEAGFSKIEVERHGCVVGRGVLCAA